MSPAQSSLFLFLKVEPSIKIPGAELKNRTIFARLSIWLVWNEFFGIRIKYLLFSNMYREGSSEK
jgi:hypothetical protein